MANIDEVWPNMANALDTYGGNLLKSTVMLAAFQPFTVVRVLIQLGHEPIEPVLCQHRFLGIFPTKKYVNCYPNVFKYLGHIKRTDGYTGLYRGLGPRIIHELINKTVGNALVEKMKDEEEVELDRASASVFVQETMKLAVVKSTCYIISYPFHAISIRMIAQFAGGESSYSNALTSIREIYQEEGITGFFKGLIPGLIGELVMLGVMRALNYVITNYVLSEELSKVQDGKVVSSGVANYCANYCSYPFQVVTNVMCVNDTKLSVGKSPIYSDWTECWFSLGAVGRSRGSALLLRTAGKPFIHSM